jgi:D-alanine-D-alanine ligase
MKVAIICGGPSSEHEVSCISAAGVLSAIDRSKYEPVLIGITKTRKWVLLPLDHEFKISNGVLPSVPENAPEISSDLTKLNVEIAFPVLHGAYGEDGEIQKHFESIGIKYVGNGVEASANAMDKSIAKDIFKKAGLKVASGAVLKLGDEISDLGVGYPLFVKPASGGSSRGTHKVNSPTELQAAVTDAFKFDSKVLLEKAIVGREIEVAVLESKGASVPGEIKIDPKFEFYDFEAKYLDGATMVLIPADLPAEVSEKIKELAQIAFDSLGCKGLARVDFFYTADGELIINELNTMPGFTPTSVFPKLWNQSGVSYSEIISELIKNCR